MNNILIAVPTKERADKINKLITILETCNTDYKVFVEPQEVYAYEKVVPTHNIEVLEKNDEGLTYALQTIKDYAIRNDYQYVWKMDDDLKGFHKQGQTTSGTAGLKHACSNQIKILKKAKKFLSKERYHIGVSFPQGNHLFGEPNKFKTRTTYIIDSMFWFLPDEVEYFHDFLQTLEALSQGCVIGSFWEYGFSAGKVGKMDGGLQSDKLDREQFINESLEYITSNYSKARIKETDKAVGGGKEPFFSLRDEWKGFIQPFPES